MSTIAVVIWGIVKIIAIAVFFANVITYAIAYYERANTPFEKAGNEPLPGILQILLSFLFELITIYISIIIYPIGYIEPDPLREINTSSGERPVILVHGYFMNRASFLVFYLRLRQTGKKAVFTINLRPLTSPIEDLAQQLAEKVEEVMLLTKMEKVDIVAHSMGGLAARYYIEQLGGANKVYTFVNIGSPNHGTKLSVFGFGANAREMRPNSDFIKSLETTISNSGNVRYFSIWSTFDNIILPQESPVLPEPATNIKFHNIGHLALLFSQRVFLKVRELLEEKENIP